MYRFPGWADEMSAESLFRSIVSPPPYYAGPPLANRLGLQVVRIALAHLRFRLRRRPAPGAAAAALETLERDGIVTIPDLLPPADFDRLRIAIDSLRESGRFRLEPDRDGTGADWLHGPIPLDCEEGRWIVDVLTRDTPLLPLVAAGMRRRIRRRPQIIYQRLSVPSDRMHLRDEEGVIHADRHFPNFKAYYTLTQTGEDQGAYVFCPGSHRLTRARMRHEYEYSTREAAALSGRPMSGAFTIDGRNAVSPEAARDMGLVETPIRTGANTLIVSNNVGFHKRGTIAPGQTREQLRVIFHYLEEPLVARIMWSGARLLQRAGLLPKSLCDRLERAGITLGDHR